MTDKEILQALGRQFFFASFWEQKRQDKLLGILGLSYNSYRCLWYINDHPGGVEPSVMADDLLVTRQTITTLCSSLEKEGYIQRQISPEDRRRILVTLLPKGQELVDRINEIIDDYHSYILQNVDREDLERYVILRKQFCDVREAAISDVLKKHKIDITK